MPSTALHQQQQLIAALQVPERFPHMVKSVRVIETHISWVLLAGRYAYKIKKAVDLGFLNATELASRQMFCEEELRLNRRLAPQLYLEVIPIGGSPDHPQLNALPVIEYAVKMRRFALSKTFDQLILRNKVLPQHMDALANRLARFHQQAPAVKVDAAIVQHALEENFTQLAALLNKLGRDLSRQDCVGINPDLQHLLTSLQRRSEQAFATLEQRITERDTQGYVRECHGDLHLGNIALIGDQPTPFDGIDFNPALRNIDVMDEVAFLFMDLLHHHRTDLAYRFLNAYLALTGDYAGVELLNFYCAYRATVRAKVHAIQNDNSGTYSNCHDYLTLAHECLVPKQARLLLMHGLTGSGKSTFAQAALERIGAIRLRTDVERKRLFGLSALEKSPAHRKHLIYSAEATQQTYRHILDLTQRLLNAGHTVIVDAAFLKHDEREMFQQLSVVMKVPFAIISMQASEATMHARITRRLALGNDASEADITVMQQLQAIAEVLTVDELKHTIAIPNEGDHSISEYTWQRLEDFLRTAISQ